MAGLSLSGVRKSYGATTVLQERCPGRGTHRRRVGPGR